jgi:hypothetical protein
MNPSYVHCPKCAFPMVVPSGRRHALQLCRQCSSRFTIPHENDAKPGIDSQSSNGVLTTGGSANSTKR